MAPAVAIIGGGPCGLALARFLERKAIDYVVYERDDSESSNRSGGSLDLHPETGQRALQESGLLDEFKKHARYEDTVFKLADKSGKRWVEMGQGRDAPEIDRVELRRILIESIPEEKIKWGHKLANATLGEDNKPVLQFANGFVASGFKLVVGADGAWSKVRSLVTQARPQYSGKSYIEARIQPENPFYETIAKDAGAGMLMAIGSGKPITIQRQGDGSYRIYFGVKVEEDSFRNGTIDIQDIEATRRLLLSAKYYADWSEEYKQLIRHSTDFRGWSLHHLAAEELNWKTVPGVTLLGDAAHLAVPNGEGVNLALFDSLMLASKIGEHRMENLDKAVEEYEKEMFPRGIDSVKQGHAMLEVMYSDSPQGLIDLFGSMQASAE